MADNSALPEVPLFDLIVAEIEGMSPEDRRRVNEAAATICADLQKLADEQVQKKNQIETRWLQDERQNHGRYDPDTEQKLKDANQSRVFANLTRPKTNAWASRISDILFPTDDKNWAIEPTPVPELAAQLEGAKFEARRLTKQANMYHLLASQATEEQYFKEMTAKKIEAATAAIPLAQKGLELDRVFEEASARAEAMEKEIEDQLVEAQYSEKARTAIKDMCRLGTAIMKGPLSKTRVRGKWNVVGKEWVLKSIQDPRPNWVRVDPWGYFPDMSARTIAEAEFHFERHLMGKRELRKLARTPGFDREAIRQILLNQPKATTPNYLQQQREITGNQALTIDNKWAVWEYTGPLEGRQIDTLARTLFPAKEAAEIISTFNTVEDPLKEQQVIFWFCEGRPFKMAPHPLDSGEPIYSAASFVEDPTSIFGFGVPYLARNAQAIINAAWRLMMDNADISVGPQVVINRNVIEPGTANDWALSGFKTWLYQVGKTLPPGSPEPFQVFQTPSNVQYLLEVIKLGMMFLDEEISLPMTAQGEQGSHPETAEGRAILMNSANVIFRDAVRNWDDKITVPDLRRTYDWNMQHSRKEHIKGDMDVKATGSSVLLVKDMQTQNLGMFLKQFGESPIYGPFVKHKDGLREMAKTMMLGSAKIVKTDEEIQQDEQAAQMNPPPPTPEELKLQGQREQIQAQQNIAGMTLQTRMLEMAQKSNLTLDQITAQLAKADADRRSKEKLAGVDAALTMRQIEIKKAEPKPNISTTGTTQ